MTSTEIGRPQTSGGCPYKVLNSQWVPTRPEAMTKNDQMNVTTLHLQKYIVGYTQHRDGSSIFQRGR